MVNLQQLFEEQAIIKLIHEAYKIKCQQKGLDYAPLHINVNGMMTINPEFTEALKRYIVMNGFERLASLEQVEKTHQKIINS